MIPERATRASFRAGAAAAIGAVAISSASAYGGDSLSQNVPITGGTAALAHALKIQTVPDRARYVTELTRVIYDVPEGKNAATDAQLQDLAKHLETADRFQKALAAVQPGSESITLAMADQKNNRARLKDFLDLVGLKLREKSRKFSVERTDSKQAAERLRVLTELGVNLDQLAAKLNAGEAVRIDVPTELVPIPLTAELWGRIIFRRQTVPGVLFSSIMSDRRAALLCYGLAALDDETLQFFVDRPQLLTRVYEHDAGPFSAFAGSLRVRGGRVVVPGGEPAVPLWQAVVGEDPAHAERFVREIFSKDAGRVAYLYDAISQLDEGRARFALGMTIENPSRRIERFRSLAATLTANDHLDFANRPFHRPGSDTVLLLTRVHTQTNGAPAPPAWQKFWSRAFDSIDLPDNAAKQLKNFQEDGVVDAAWLAEAVENADIRFRRERLDQLDFGHRVFASAEPASLPDALVAVRAFPRYRTLMLTLERMGIRTPAVYVTAARQADRLSGLNANNGFVALSQFEGALALISRMTRVHTIDAERAAALVSSLSIVPLGGNGRFNGAIARWLNEQLVPALGRKAADVDDALVAALAGPPSALPRVITWEDRRYRVDLAAAEARRLAAMRDKIAAPPIATPAALVETADALRASDLQLGALAPLLADLQKIEATLVPPARKKNQAPAVLPAGVTERANPYEIVARAVQNLSKIKKPKDMKAADHDAEPLFEAVDSLLADALLSLDYALNLGDPEGDAMLAGNVSRRHDFGFTESLGELRMRAPWTIPLQMFQPGVPWHVRGSALGLDVGLSSLALRQLSAKGGATSALTDVERNTLSDTVALMNAFDLGDVDADAVAAAIDQGRARVTAMATAENSFDAIAESLHIDAWRRRAIQWSLANDRENTLSFFSLRELLYLGNSGQEADTDRIGNGTRAFDGCFCTQLAAPGAWILSRGRTQSGQMTLYISDLTLRIMVVLHEHRLPATLLPGVLAFAMQDYVNEVRRIEGDDWLSMIRAAQKVPRERIEDYIAALTAGGPLTPESTASGGHP